MKTMFLSLIAFCAFGVCFAQTKTDTTAKMVLTKQSQITNPRQTLKTPGTNMVVEKLPDLRTTAATVTAVATSPGVYKLTIQCTVKNEGNAPISLGSITLKGLLAAERSLHLPLNATAYSPACGRVAGLARETLQPGESVPVEYYCFNVAMAQSDKPVYVLLINYLADIKEQNKENNRQNVYITFN